VTSDVAVVNLENYTQFTNYKRADFSVVRTQRDAGLSHRRVSACVGGLFEQTYVDDSVIDIPPRGRDDAGVSAADDALYVEFGQRLRSFRERAGLTQHQLATFLGLSRTSISNVEAGRQRIPLHHVYALAGAVNCRIEELLPARPDGLYQLLLDRYDEADRLVIDTFVAEIKGTRPHANAST
jgi:transcriptional regulator with XRE-family HTH domain